MPEPGTIPDPRMNPKERKFGIIKVNGVYCAYDKVDKQNPKRKLPFGYQVDESIIKYKHKLTNPIFWNGHTVEHEVDFNIEENTHIQQEPMVVLIHTYLSGISEDDWPVKSSEL
jgi:hypothetical protein